MTYQQRIEYEWAENQLHHDLTGEHVWIDITVFNEPARHLVCPYCRVEQWIPFEPMKES
jgi:hypothetical protein